MTPQKNLHHSSVSMQDACCLEEYCNRGPLVPCELKSQEELVEELARPPPRTHQHLLFHGKELEKLWLKLNVWAWHIYGHFTDNTLRGSCAALTQTPLCLQIHPQ